MKSKKPSKTATRPADGHLGQGVGVHGGLHLGIHLFRAADAGGIDGLIAQRLQHGGGILQNFGFLLQIGEGVHAAVGEDDHFAQGGDLVEHAVGGEADLSEDAGLCP